MSCFYTQISYLVCIHYYVPNIKFKKLFSSNDHMLIIQFSITEQQNDSIFLKWCQTSKNKTKQKPSQKHICHIVLAPLFQFYFTLKTVAIYLSANNETGRPITKKLKQPKLAYVDNILMMMSSYRNLLSYFSLLFGEGLAIKVQFVTVWN